MPEKTPLSRLIPSWRQLSFHGRSPLFKVSFAMTVLVPVWARLLNNIGDVELFSQILKLFDADICFIPDNLLRIFWASFATTISAVIYTVSCPEILRRYDNFQQWIDQDEEAYLKLRSMTSKHGEARSDIILRDLRHHYISEVANNSYNRVWARIIITFLYIVSAVLILRVLWDQFMAVFTHTTLHLLFL